MGFSTVFAGIVVLAIMMSFAGIALSLLIKAGLASIEAFRAEAERGRAELGEKIDVLAVSYDAEANCFVIKLMNVGSRTIYDMKGLDIILHYTSADGRAVAEYLVFNVTWTPLFVELGDFRAEYVNERPLYPGETLVLKTIALPQPSSTPLTIVVSTKSGFTAEKRVTVGG